MSRNIPITEFDTLTVNPSMQMLKALVPFLDYSMQRQVSLIIRITELQQTMQFFSNPSSVSGFSSSTGYAKKIHSIDDIFNNEELIDSLLVYCPENYASMIKTFRQFSKMSDLFNMMNLSNEDMGNMFNTFFKGNSDEAAGNGFNAASKDNSKRDYNSNDSSNGANNSNSSNNSGTGNPFGKLPPSLNMGGLGNLFASGPANSLINNFMKPEQQAMYDEYIRQLNSLNFDEPANKQENKPQNDTENKSENNSGPQ